MNLGMWALVPTFDALRVETWVDPITGLGRKFQVTCAAVVLDEQTFYVFPPEGVEWSWRSHEPKQPPRSTYSRREGYVAPVAVGRVL